MEAAELGMWSYDPVERVFTADATMQRIFGSPAPAGGFDYWITMLHPEDRERAETHFTQALAGELPYDIEYRILRSDGIRWLRSKGRVVGGKDAPQRMFAIVEDITDRKRTEEALRSSEDRLRQAQRSGRIASWEWDLATGNFIWDEASAWTYGRPPSEMTHYNQILPYLHEDDRDMVIKDLKPAVEGRGEYRSEFRVIWPDDSTHWIQAFGRPVAGADGKPICIIGINMEITERKLAELALIENEKLAAVGRLASSIAHEINNPLESVTNLLYLAQGSEDIREARVYLATAEAELRRASAITSQTLRFHKQATRPREVSGEDLVAGAMVGYYSRIRNANIQLEVRHASSQRVTCFDGEIRQVLSNLIGNALDAMQNTPGRLLIHSREGHNWKSGRKGVIVTVADTGIGMSRRTVAKVFEAFFTTKGMNGTGLGLWISKEIVDRHQGVLRIRSSQQPGRSGTVFRLFLPFDTAPRNA